jgi:uncharacterized protein (TIGR02246 family)
MRKVVLFPVPALLVFMAIGCQPPEQELAPLRTLEQVRADAEVLTATWVEMANAEDAAGVASTYTEDAVFLDPYGNVIQGRAAIEGYFRQSFATRTSNFESLIDDMVILGDAVASYGTWSATIEGLPSEFPGPWRWMALGVYQPDGSFKTRLQLAMIPAPMPEM